MILTLIISITTIILMIVSILFYPTVKIKKVQVNTYWIITLIGALLILICGLVPIKDFYQTLISKEEINPLKILILFFSMTFLSVYLDELGFFKYLAIKVTNLAKNNQYSIFITLFVAVSVLTVFTSNDIIILTFTPFICYLCKRLMIKPLPFLISEFVAANTLSMTLIIGNPTNIYLGLNCGIDFITYFLDMGIISFSCAIFALMLLMIIFHKSLSQPILKSNTDVKLENKFLVIVGTIILLTCTFLMAISNYINLQMWLVALISAICLLIISLVYKISKKVSGVEKQVFFRLPWQLIPFLLSMFILVLALDRHGVSKFFSDFLGDEFTPYTYGFSSMFVANIINNIPMTVLYSTVVDVTNLKMVYATIIGSNLAACLTPLGSLAGIMWMDILKANDVKFSFGNFVKYGAIIALTLGLFAFTLLLLL